MRQVKKNGIKYNIMISLIILNLNDSCTSIKCRNFPFVFKSKGNLPATYNAEA